MIGKILLGLGVLGGAYLLVRGESDSSASSSKPGPALDAVACAKILSALPSSVRGYVANRVQTMFSGGMDPQVIANAAADELAADGFPNAAACVRSNPALVSDVLTGSASQVNPSSGLPSSFGPSGPVSFVTPRNPPSFDPANPLGAILPPDTFARVTAILNNYQASGWRGMTVNDFSYLADVARDYPASAPYLEAARQAFVAGYFSGMH